MKTIVDKKNIEDILALTPMQEGMLFHYLRNRDSQQYFEQLCLDIYGEINPTLFKKAWYLVTRANEMLRTVFRWENMQQPVQVVLKEHEPFVSIHNTVEGESLEEIKRQDLEKGFDLTVVPFRITLCKTGEENATIIISNHHILYDGWSSGIVLSEFFKVYDALKNNTTFTIPPKSNFKLFIDWLKNRETSEEAAFWQQYLRNSRADKGNQTNFGKKREITGSGHHRVQLPAALRDRLEEFVKSLNITAASVLYCAWGILLQKYNERSDVIFDTTVSGRRAGIHGIEKMVGLFINTLPIRSTTRPNETTVEFLTRSHRELQRWSQFENTPLSVINECLDWRQGEELFDSVVVIENYPLDNIMLRENSAISVKSFSITGMTQYDVTLLITVFDDIIFSFTYNKELFSEYLIDLINTDLVELIKVLISSSVVKISDLLFESGDVPKTLRQQRQSMTADTEREAILTAPRDSLEKKLVEEWAGLFGVENSDIGIDTDFFDFGGHSLKASLLARRLHRVLNVKVPLAEIFKSPTIRELAGYINGVEKSQHITIEAAEEQEYYPASPVQVRMYTLQQMEPESIAYNVSAFLELSGELSLAQAKTMEQVFQALIRRHESLRTSIHVFGGEPVQQVHNTAGFEIKHFELASESTGTAINSFIRPFDLSRVPLLRIGLVKLSDREHLLMFDAHHIISDGTSMNVFINEFMELYSGKELPNPRLHYKDFSQWQRRQILSGELKNQESYWLDSFSGELPVLSLPTDFPRTAVGTGRFEGRTISVTINSRIRRELRRLERRTSATLYMVMLAAYNVLLMKYSGQEDIVVGTITDGRPHPDLENVMGVLINTLAMRNYPQRDKSFENFLRQIKTNTLNAFENGDYQFEELLKNINFQRDIERNPLFDTMFLLQNYQWTDLSLPGLEFKPHKFNTNASTFDLRLTAIEITEGIDLEIQYAARLFKESSIRRLASHLITILEEAARQPRQKLGEIGILTKEEREHILVEFNRSETDTGERKPIYQMFEDRVEKSPEAPALIYKHEVITYNALNQRVNRLAHFLRKQGAEGQPVGILLPPAPPVVESILAIWKAGSAYIPIDPQYPLQRIKQVVGDSGARLLLTRTAALTTEVETVFQDHLFFLDHVEKEIRRQLPENPQSLPDIDSPAYIIYTSGSTGKPKGAGVYHRGFSNLMNWFVTDFKFTHSDSNLLITSLSFDLTQKNIFAPLITGGRLTLPGQGYFDPRYIVNLVENQRITWLNCTPSMIYKIVEYCSEIELNKLTSLQFLFLGGEPISMGLLVKWIKTPDFRTEIVNTYGPTECTDICASHRLTDPDVNGDDIIPIGKPISNVQLYILDPSLQPVPVGHPGELYIGGDGVGMGYINNHQLTEEKFIEIPGNTLNRPGENRQSHKMYRTGDLARWLPNGNIEFIGRVDDQVKIRGFRIELGEIENQLLNHPRVKAAVVLALDRKTSSHQPSNETFLCAYVVLDGEVSGAQLKEYLADQLPDYMTPSFIMLMDAIPLTPHGKVDRKKLPEPNADAAMGAGNDDSAPANEAERILAKTWESVLGVHGIGTGDSFFDLGGDSLQVIQVIARLREEYGSEIPVKLFFHQPTIGALAPHMGERKDETIHIAHAPGDVEIPLTFAQESLWFLQQLDDENPAYFVPRVVRIKGRLDPEVVEQTFNEIMRRQEILRTTFPSIEGRPVQRVLPHTPFTLPIIDFSVQEDESLTRSVTAWLKEEGRRPFDFENEPMIRVNLVKLNEEEHLLVNTEHHLVHDGWTQGVLLKEFLTIFDAFSKGEPSPLPELPIQYKDFAYWQRNYFRGDVLETLLDYWQRKLAGAPPLLNLPTDRPRPAVNKGSGDEKRLFLSRELSGSLIDFSREHETTLYMTMLAVFKILLYRYSGETDICVGAGVANRQYKEMEGMLGMVINTFALRTELSDNMSFSQCLEEVKTTCLEAYEHQDAPFEKVVERIQPQRSLSYNPIFQVAFSFMDTPAERLFISGLELIVEPSHNRSAKFDINIVVEPPMAERIDETGGRIEIVWEYNTDLFDAATMEQMLSHYNRLLEESLLHPEHPVSYVPLLDKGETRQLLNRLNDTEIPYPQQLTVHRLFETQVEKTPDHTAVSEPGAVFITCAELNRKSNYFARVLRENGVCADSIVAVLAEPRVEMIIGIMSILKAGGAYLPINPASPPGRIGYILNDSAISVLLTQKEIPIEGNLIRLDLDAHDPGSGSEVAPNDVPDNGSRPNDLAYVIYTSGSTGRPKGVGVEHVQLVNFLYHMYNRYGGKVDCNDRCLSLTNMMFDVSVWEFFLPLSFGAQLILLQERKRSDVPALTDAILDEKITLMYLPPGLLTEVYQQLKQQPARVKLNKMLVGVEPIRDAVLESYMELNPEMSIINGYGPTETTICATSLNYTSHCSSGEIVPIGTPLANIRVVLLDPGNNIVPQGVPGEICISGVGVSRGYLNNPELTAEKFTPHPHLDDSRMYRTGDMARLLPDGNIQFVGRRDHQVKIRGHRIELGEIENRILEQKDIAQAVVMARSDETGGQYLCAYIVSEAKIGAPELREFLAKYLPEYMIPTYFVTLENIPLTPNGKVNRQALPVPDMLSSNDEYRAPQDELEKKLAVIWSEILGIDENGIGISANFFNLGGHSLKAARLAARIHRVFDIKVPVAQFFRTGTIEGLAQYIKFNEKSRFINITKAEEAEFYPLSSAQKRLYILHRMDKNTTAYNIPSVLGLDGPLDKKRFEETFCKLVQRHESLRTSFHTLGNDPVQRIHDDVDFKIEYFDQPGQENGNSNYKNPKLYIQDSFIRPFDLSKAPMLRVALIREQKKQHILAMDMHHIITDGTSMSILAAEFMALYSGEELPVPAVQYKDFSVWQNRLQHDKAMKLRETYWLNQFPGEIPVLALPLDHPRPAVQRFDGKTRHFKIDKHETAGLKSLAREQEVTMFMVLLSLYKVVLMKLTGQEDIVVGTPVAGRPHADLESVIGMFINTLGIRSFPTAQKSFTGFLQEVKKITLEAFENQEYPFEELVEKVAVNRDTSRNPLFDVMLILQNMEQAEVEIPGLKLRVRDYEKNNSKFDLTLSAVEESEQILFSLEYSTALFQESTIERFTAFILNALAQILAEPDQKLSSIEIVSVDEKERLLIDFNRTAAQYPGHLAVHRLFEAQVVKSPDYTAVLESEAVSITYGHLNRKANQLARVLQNHGVCADSIAAVMTEPCIEMVIGILAILKAGGAYLPITPTTPPGRIDYILKDSAVSLVLSHSGFSGETGFNGKYFHLDRGDLYAGCDSDLNPDGQSRSRDLAYVIYTSGSTGRPKGVGVEHAQLVNFLYHMYNRYEGKLNNRDRCLSLTNMMFDVSVWEYFLPLSFGAQLLLLPEDKRFDTLALADTIMDEGITLIYLPPGLLREVNERLKHRPSRVILNKLLVGVEPIRDEVLESYMELNPEMSIINGYGPTETTICATSLRYMSHWPTGETVPIGKPLANTGIVLLDTGDNIVPQGLPGEICISGDGISRGYLNNPELTVDKFPLHPHLDNSRMYRTGDLARMLPDGNFLFLGRKDQQLKISGYRIELGEIENRILEHMYITQAFVLARTNDSAGQYLCAYIVAGIPIGLSDLREFLSNDLPAYMIPSYMVQLEQIPLTANGKVNREALPDPESETADYIPPRNSIERELVEKFAKVLDISEETISIDTDFFQLGGNSLKASLLVSRIHESMEVDVPVAKIFTHRTTRRIAGFIRGCGRYEFMPIPTAVKRPFYPISSPQKRLFILHQMKAQGTSYNVPGVFRLDGHLDREKFQTVFLELIQRHDSFRTTFEWVEEEPVQRIHENREFSFESFDLLTDGPAAGIIDSFVRPFNLETAPLLRAGLVKLEEEKHLLLVDMHHIISDGTSMKILVKEFAALYNGDVLPRPTIRYKDFAVWQNSPAYRETMEQQKAFWLEEFEGEIPILELPTDFSRPGLQSFEGAREEIRLPDHLIHRLNRLAITNGVSLFTVLLTLYNVFLAKMTQQEFIVVGSPAAGRRHADLEGIIGMFVNTLALKNYPRGNQTFTELLLQVHTKNIDALANQDFPYEELVEILDLNRDASRNPLFDTMFVLHDEEAPELTVPGLSIHPYPFENRVTKFDLTLKAIKTAESLELTMEYCSRLFKHSTVERFSRYFREIVTDILSTPGARLSEIDLMPSQEKHLLLKSFNSTGREYPGDQTLDELFAAQADHTPDSIALEYRDIQLSYAHLNAVADVLAERLQEQGAAPGTIVALAAERSHETIYAILAILKTGAAYLPIDPVYPEERIQYMIKDSNAAIVLTSAKLSQISLETDRHPPLLKSQRNSSSPAYIIYTSGSTGRPKGVLIEHRSVVNLVYNQKEEFGINNSERIMQFSTISFDASVEQIFLALLSGAVLVLVEKETLLENHRFEAFIAGRCITHLHAVPEFLGTVRLTKGHGLRRIASGGDVCSVSLAKKWLRFCNFYNKYGPTETTVTSLEMHYTKAVEIGETLPRIPIGRPIANTSVYLLDKWKKPVPMGVIGELFIGGNGTARGYLNQPDLTAEKFVFHHLPISDSEFLVERLYQTGDLCRWQPDGKMGFLGRIDQQVKIRGFRIEPGEIEHRLSMHSQVKEAVVTARGDSRNGQYLCAYIVSVAGEFGAVEQEIRKYLSTALPEYMVPSHFIHMNKLPLTPNGKIDRKALPEPEKPGSSREYAEPRNKTEVRMTTMWAEILGTEMDRIGMDDNFFSLGGHSLKATVLLSRIHKEFDVAVPLEVMFKTPTIRSLSRYVEDMEKRRWQPINPVELKEFYSASSPQKRLYALQQMNPESTAYNMPDAFILEGDLDPGKLEKSFSHLVQRHESLRTYFIMVCGDVVQRIRHKVDFSIEYCSRDIDSFIRPFKLAHAPLLRVGVIKEKEKKFTLVVDMHHTIADGISRSILIDEFIKFYKGAELSPLRIQYKDYREWLDLPQQSNQMIRSQSFWLKNLEGELPVLALPYDYPPERAVGIEGKTVHFRIEREDSRELNQMAREAHTTLFNVMLAIYFVFLAKISGQEDIIVGTPIAGRNHSDLESIVGMFVNTLPMRQFPKGNKTFRDFLNQVKHFAVEAFQHQDCPLENLANLLAKALNFGRNQLFDTMFATATKEHLEMDIPGLALTPHPARNTVPKFPLTVLVHEGEQLSISCEYKTSLFNNETIERFAGYFKDIVSEVTKDRGIKLENILISHDLVISAPVEMEKDFIF